MSVTLPPPPMVEAHQARTRQDVTNPLSFYFKAELCRDDGDLAGWRRHIMAAFAMPHRTYQQRYHRAWAKLMLGDWSAWQDYEARLRAPDTSLSTTLWDWVQWTHCPWDGIEDSKNLTLLVLSEQGVGDCIQMLRFIPPLIERTQTVIVIVYPRLVPLLQCNFGDRIELLIFGVNKPFIFDRYVRMMSLPALMGGLPPFTPLRAPGRRLRLARRSRPLRGGMCWAGNPAYEDDETRTMPATFLEPLMARTDVEWYSLQVGIRSVDADAYSSMKRPWPPLITFADTADLVMELDFVVTVDTAVAHLAGSLNVPTYLMLSHRHDGRWGLGERTDWYPSIKLLRQSTAGNWSEVIRRVQGEIDDALAAATPVSVHV